jgi:hypothetical protein
MRLRHLLWRSVPCDYPQCPVTITAREKLHHLTAMLDVASKFPTLLADGSPANESHAVSWLLDHPQLLEQLCHSQSMSATDAAGVTM